MHTTIVYDSEYGNTAQVAEAIAAEFRATSAVEMINVRTAKMTIPATVDLLVVGGPTQMHHVSPPLRAQLDALPAHALRNVNLATFDTRAHGPRLFTGAASGGIAKALTRRGAKLVTEPESFIVDGKEGPLAEGELVRAHAWAQTLVSALQTPAKAAEKERTA